jgi:DNA-binding transcriptional ArsR family regulator
LSDESRVRTLLALRKGELCVCQIKELFGLAPSTVSKHLSILFQAGLAESRKEGRWIYYSLPGKSAPVAVREVMFMNSRTDGYFAKRRNIDNTSFRRRQLPRAEVGWRVGGSSCIPSRGC